MSLSLTDRYARDRVPSAGRLLIGGHWRDPYSDARWRHVNPASGEHLTDVAVAGKRDVDDAVRAARQAFDEGPWPGMRPRERHRILLDLASSFERHAEEISRLQTFDNGMPIARSRRYRSSAAFGADLVRYYAGWSDKLTGETFPPFTDDDRMQFMSFREPVGVVAAIIPWNAPVLQFANKVAPALAAGCTMVLKPSEHASLAALRLAELIGESDLPPGVFNLVTGTGRETGAPLAEHPGVDKIAFTGGRAAGASMLHAAAGGIKRVTLELGGKSPALVFPDVPDLTAAAAEIASVVFHGMSGQTCSAQTRALVHADVHDAFVAELIRQAELVRHGDPFDETTTASPIINARQLAHVESCLDKAIAEGARPVLRGERLGGELAAGHWMSPTVLVDADNTGHIARTEVFGPVISVLPFRTEDEAVALANDSDYGLAAGVYTADNARTMRLARRLRAGTVGVNGYSFMPNSPFGGMKTSGLGREGGRPAIEAYLETKTVMLAVDPAEPAPSITRESR
ncbi:aldehyde dehydrogenase [Actinomadura sp. NBRC 104412]|uniref:aldehyde dehydrogenase family protein n=1 Tax=Actinomadura sp. NBRC 104412 TaxID=3032203 RepID=UPI0024A5FD6D|nr:aldehyde dehydrogenase family protein [Actinomadura sp. NBRC 104412]GLZ07519.1 aldehyde dehydrogenase [Actinomadura sp. NBRC 104412]